MQGIKFNDWSIIYNSSRCVSYFYRYEIFIEDLIHTRLITKFILYVSRQIVWKLSTCILELVHCQIVVCLTLGKNKWLYINLIYPFTCYKSKLIEILVTKVFKIWNWVRLNVHFWETKYTLLYRQDIFLLSQIYL